MWTCGNKVWIFIDNILKVTRDVLYSKLRNRGWKNNTKKNH